jgi:nuclear transport factor 2 (NTF2) superfamily protein
MPAKQLRPPLPPFDRDSAIKKVRLAEDAWNSRDPDRVSLAYSIDSAWRNRAEFVTGREAIVDRIAVRFAYEWHDDSGHWYRSYGNENWEFGSDGLMLRRFASINDLPISEVERKYFWPLGRRPDDDPGLSELGL